MAVPKALERLSCISCCVGWDTYRKNSRGYTHRMRSTLVPPIVSKDIH